MYTTNLKHISSNNRKLLRNNQSKNMSIKDMQFLCEMLPGIILHAACIPQTLSIFSPNTRKYYTAINQASINICCFYVKCYHQFNYLFGYCNPKFPISRIISTSQAVQDKLCTYYRSSLDQELQSNASSLHVIGYRTGMITASGALFI